VSFPRYPRYKSSGVEWLGEVPEHWMFAKLRHGVRSIESGGTPESGNHAFWHDVADEGGTHWVTIADMTRAELIVDTERRLTAAGLQSRRLRVFEPGTLLYSIYASIGKVAVLGIPAAVNQAILAVEPEHDQVDGTYLKYWLRSLESHLEQFVTSNTQDNLNAASRAARHRHIPRQRDGQDRRPRRRAGAAG
jgi:type I restriction enzyme S subunit